MAITFEETNYTLMTSDLNASLEIIPYLIWKVISMGAHKRTVFMQAVIESDALVGVDGNKLVVPKLGVGEFTAETISESALDSGGYVKTKLSPASTKISIGDIAYVATRISDVLLEDSPSLNWVRASLIKMGEALAVKIDASVRDALLTGAGQTVDATTAGTLAYDDVVKVKTKMRTASMFESEGGPFMLFIHPEQEQDLLLTFGRSVGSTGGVYVPVERYSVGEIPLVAETGTFAGCRVLTTDNMTKALALVVAPPTHAFGPSVIFAWKRHLKSESWRDEQSGRDLWLLSARYGIGVVQADLVGLISNC